MDIGEMINSPGIGIEQITNMVIIMAVLSFMIIGTRKLKQKALSPKDIEVEKTKFIYDIREIAYFALKRLAAIIILRIYIGSIPTSIFWALLLVIGWEMLWRFPNIGLGYVENWMFWELPKQKSEEFAEVVRVLYYRVVYGGFQLLILIMAAKYILSVYMSTEIAAAASEIVIAAVALQFLYSFPYIGLREIWWILPKQIPRIEFSDTAYMSDEPVVKLTRKGKKEAVVEIANHSDQIVKGNVEVYELREFNYYTHFSFEVKPGETITQTVALKTWPRVLWFICARVEYLEPETLRHTIRCVQPENRDIKQRLFRSIFKISNNYAAVP